MGKAKTYMKINNLTIMRVYVVIVNFGFKNKYCTNCCTYNILMGH